MVAEPEPELAQFAVEESKLRLEAGYALPWDEPREYFAYRLGLLKKNLQQALYLNTRQLQRDNYLRNSAAMVGAGLAATWTFLAQTPMPASAAVDSRAQMVLLAIAGDELYRHEHALMPVQLIRRGSTGAPKS